MRKFGGALGLVLTAFLLTGCVAGGGYETYRGPIVYDAQPYHGGGYVGRRARPVGPAVAPPGRRGHYREHYRPGPPREARHHRPYRPDPRYRRGGHRGYR